MVNMRLLPFRNLAVLMFAALGTASRSNAATIIYSVPPGLTPGDTYRLVFVTADTITAGVGDIDYYNTFVTNEADAVPALAALGATWTVIGATDAVSAPANVGVTDSGTIWNLAGIEIAPSTAALFNTENTSLLNPIDPQVSAVWTGAGPDGTAVDGGLGGTYAFFVYYAIVGDSGSTSANYLDERTVGTGFGLPMYAISSPLTVPADTPEPTTSGLITLGGAFLLLARRRQHPQGHPNGPPLVPK